MIVLKVSVYWYVLAVCLLLNTFVSMALADIQKIKIATSRYHSAKYLQLVKQQPCYKQQETTFATPYRGAIEIHLLCQLFNAVNFKTEFQFIPAFDYSHAVRMVEEGEADMIGETTWSNTVSPHVLQSEPIYRKNEYILGLYTSPDRAKQLQIMSVDDLNGLVGVSNKLWVNDWRLLNAMPLRKNISKQTAFEMFSFVKRGYADFVLWPFYFQEDNFAYTLTPIENFPEGHFRLVPVANVKVTVPYSRHYIVSKHSQSGQVIIRSLNKAIKQFRSKGKIRQYYIDSGFFNEQVDRWTPLNLSVD